MARVKPVTASLIPSPPSRDSYVAETTELARLRRLVESRREADVLRRALRDSPSLDDVPARAVAYASAELGGVPCVYFQEEVAEPRFVLRASTFAVAERSFVARDPALTATLRQSPTELPEGLAAGVFENDELVGLLVATDVFDADATSLSLAAEEVTRAVTALARSKSREEALAAAAEHEEQLASLLVAFNERDNAFQEELRDARAFQQQIVALPPVTGARVTAFYEPMSIIGGDLYALRQEGSRIRLFVADATGHGIRAAMTTMFIKNAFQTFAGLDSPSRLLEALNDSIASSKLATELMFSAICADVDTATGRVTIAAAGHPPACAVQRNELLLVEPNGAPMGVMAGMKYETAELTLASGDGLYLYTDGLSEARYNGSYLGDDRLHEAIRAAHAAGKDVGTAVRAELLEFVGSYALSDDASLIGLRLD